MKPHVLSVDEGGNSYHVKLLCELNETMHVESIRISVPAHASY